MELSQRLFQLFPQLKDISIDGKGIVERLEQVVIPANTTLFRQGDSCQNYLLILSGSVKVFTRAENGREIVLYHISTGHSCVLTTSCLLSSEDYPAEGVTETDIVAVVIPGPIFDEYVALSAAFRKLVFNSYGDRLAALISLVEEISFSKLDVRLAKFLLENSSVNTPLITTHQALATELGSAREVISRQLKEFEKNGWVKLSRGKIQIMNQLALENIQ